MSANTGGHTDAAHVGTRAESTDGGRRTAFALLQACNCKVSKQETFREDLYTQAPQGISYSLDFQTGGLGMLFQYFWVTD